MNYVQPMFSVISESPKMKSQLTFFLNEEMAEKPSFKKRINISNIDLFQSDKGCWVSLCKSSTERFITTILETQGIVM